ncbi:hypothetical protein P8452_52030 [Trifolium repens]|nr:hypothetical protein P8452_52030 [Trifolium repens]
MSSHKRSRADQKPNFLFTFLAAAHSSHLWFKGLEVEIQDLLSEPTPTTLKLTHQSSDLLSVPLSHFLSLVF